MPRQNTIVLVYRDEIEQFAMLMNQGLPLDTLIHLTFKKDEEIIRDESSRNIYSKSKEIVF